MRIEEARWGKIRLLDRTARSLHIEAQRGFSDNFLKSFLSVGIEDNVPAARALTLRRRVIVKDLAQDQWSERYRTVAREEGLQAMQHTPMIAPDGRVLGTLATCFDHTFLPSTAEGLIFDHCAARAVELVQTVLQPR